jgi:hypothetical protein
VLYSTGDLSASTLHDGLTPQQPSDDEQLFNDYLTAASPASPRAMWVNGEGIAFDIFTNSVDPQSRARLTDVFGVLFVDNNYRARSGNFGPAFTDLIPRTAPFHVGRTYGFTNFCLSSSDVIQNEPTAAGAVQSMEYKNVGPPPYGASVTRTPDNALRFYRTVFDGFDLPNVFGDGAANSATNVGRLAYADDATAFLALCARRGPVVAVGDLPQDGSLTTTLQAAAPNPFRGRTTVHFSLASPTEAQLAIHNVAGRTIRTLAPRQSFAAGPHALVWDGTDDRGHRVQPGVYFLRIKTGQGFEDANKLIVLQ